jgi:hypothetical protein
LDLVDAILPPNRPATAVWSALESPVAFGAITPASASAAWPLTVDEAACAAAETVNRIAQTDNGIGRFIIVLSSLA